MSDSDNQYSLINQSTFDQDDDLELQLDKVAQQTRQQIHQDPTLAQSLATDPKMQDMVVEIEEDLFREIITRLEKSTISVEKAEQMAREFLSFLPIQDQKDLMKKLHELSIKNQEAQGIYLKYARPYEEQMRQEKIILMSKHIYEGNIEKALNVAKGDKSNG